MTDLDTSAKPASDFPPCPAPFNMAHHVLGAGRCTPDKPALEVLSADSPHPAETWTYGQISSAVRGLATGLQRAGLTPGDRVLVRLGNTADFPIAYLGIIAAGMVAVPTSSQLTRSEITKMSAQIEPALILQDAELAAPDAPGVPSIDVAEMRAMYALPPAPWHIGDPERAGYIVFTSGTSGTPRAVVHAHRAIWARKMMHDGWYALRHSDRLLHAGAFNWTFTLGTGLMDPWTLGATALIPQDGTSPDALPDLLARHQATLFAAAPGLFRKILRTDLPALPELRHALSAGEKMPPAVHAAWHTATGLQVYEAFGMSECSTFISSHPADPVPPETLGKPQAGRRVALLDEAGHEADHGVIAIHRSDPGLMLGYLNAPEATAAKMQGDWFLSGDLGTRDASGAISYAGRSDDMMNAGGFRVSPLEVEAGFHGLPGLHQIAVTEVTLKPGVQVIAAFYTADSALDETALQALATERLARYKRPRIYQHCDTLPTSANGKLLRRQLRRAYEDSHGQA